MIIYIIIQCIYRHCNYGTSIRVPINSLEFLWGVFKAPEIDFSYSGAECVDFCLCYHWALVEMVDVAVAGLMAVVSNSWHRA